MSLQQISQSRVTGGWHRQFSHHSASNNCDMRFAIFLPDSATKTSPAPVLFWLSGLTSTEENFMQKAGAFKTASTLGMVIVACDTSPRGDQVADDERYDLGQGAGFYLNATQDPWRANYYMYDYVSKELPELVQQHFPVSNAWAIAGHSMGGHGAITIGLKNPTQYRSISAFSPISNPMNCAWGEKAFTAYLGENRELWADYDATELLKTNESTIAILVDQGEADEFLVEQLKPEALIKAASISDSQLQFRMHPDFDHGYYFVSSFIDDHLQFHHQYLQT